MSLVVNEKQASTGGFSGIKKIKGTITFVSPEPEPPPEGWRSDKTQIQVKMEGTSILEMFPGEEEFELESGKFHFWEAYAKPGKRPHQNSTFVRCFVCSMNEAGLAAPKDAKDFNHLIGQEVIFEKQPRKLFSQDEVDPETKKVILGEDGKPKQKTVYATNDGLESGKPNHWCFAKEVGSDDKSVRDYLVEQLVGKNESAALRMLNMDSRLKQFSEYRDQLKAGSLAGNLGLVLVDGIFTKKEG